MAERKVKIGLSLGADICWPICYENLLNDLRLDINHGGERLTFSSERVTIEPFNLQQDVSYDVVIDRLTHWYSTSREWIKKGILLDDLYVYNNPWSLQSNEKHTSYAAMMRLGLPVPETWMLPPKAYEDSDDLQETLRKYARMFSLEDIGSQLGYPFFMKPYHGGGWKGVSKIDDLADFQRAYDESGTEVMNLQSAVLPHDWFVRCVGLGPQMRKVNYDPSAALHDRYRMDIDFLDAEDNSVLEDMTATINSFFGWDFNSCEALRRDGIWHPIDFANACPDSQVTSLHYHFPWLLKANLRWSIFCAATRRPMHRNLDWAPYFEIADKDISPREKLSRYAGIAHERFETERFREFCQTHLSHLDELAYEFFASDTVRDAIHQKVSSLFPAHEIEEFTELFWQRIQDWRAAEGAKGDPDGF
ncbi:ATP-grasp domain-containing protein [Granulosicoccus sp. 3-233]|uniref:ATP-grasp domain-containing protein n=1 Tax=Granulosicoccus sp. 3-233 TaxID=3417969 RepID=UPI003D33041C